MLGWPLCVVREKLLTFLQDLFMRVAPELCVPLGSVLFCDKDANGPAATSSSSSSVVLTVSMRLDVSSVTRELISPTTLSSQHVNSIKLSQTSTT